MAPLTLLSKLTTRLHYLYCYIALLALSVSIDFVSSSAKVTSVKSQQGILTHLVRETRTHRSDQGHLGPIKRGGGLCVLRFGWGSAEKQAGTICGDLAIGLRGSGDRARKVRENGERMRKWQAVICQGCHNNLLLCTF